VSKIKAAVLVHHGELDQALAGAWPAYNDALAAANVTDKGYIYPGANHGFDNATTPRYDAAAAKLAWARTIAWLNKYLKT
jgi:carboxymethylenebutenolidase